MFCYAFLLFVCHEVFLISTLSCTNKDKPSNLWRVMRTGLCFTLYAQVFKTVLAGIGGFMNLSVIFFFTRQLFCVEYPVASLILSSVCHLTACKCVSCSIGRVPLCLVDCGLYVVGSSLNSFGTDNSDMDLCLMLCHNQVSSFADLCPIPCPQSGRFIWCQITGWGLRFLFF